MEETASEKTTKLNYHLFIDGVLDCTTLLFLDCVALLLLDCVANLRTKTVRKIGMIDKEEEHTCSFTVLHTCSFTVLHT